MIPHFVISHWLICIRFSYDFLMGDGRPLFIYIMLRADRCSVLILNPINSAKKYFNILHVVSFLWCWLLGMKSHQWPTWIFLDLLFQRPPFLPPHLHPFHSHLHQFAMGRQEGGPEITCVSSFSKWIYRFRLLMCEMLDAFMQINCRCFLVVCPSPSLPPFSLLTTKQKWTYLIQT